MIRKKWEKVLVPNNMGNVSGTDENLQNHLLES